jgi:hypothetical protein
MSDPKNTWQSQPTEETKMSVGEVRRRARDLHEKQRDTAILWIVLGLLLAAFFGWNAVRSNGWMLRSGWGLISVWCLYGAYHARRWIWPGKLDAVASSSLEFYRRELARRRDYAQHGWLRAGLPVLFVGIALVLGPPLSKGLTAKSAPFFILLTIWFVALYFQRKRDRARLQRDIDDLNGLDG